MSNSVYIINGDRAYVNLFKDILKYQLSENIAEADLVVFTGGADVSPKLYGDAQHKQTFNDPARDRYEESQYEIALKLGIPMVGICRGGQFLNVMNGGRMYQHVSKHAGMGHMLTDHETGEQVFVSSTHHQMFMPAEHAIIIATAHLGGYREWFDGELSCRDESNTDYEVIWYPKTKCLCFQPHPEIIRPEYVGMLEYFESLLDRCFELENV